MSQIIKFEIIFIDKNDLERRTTTDIQKIIEKKLKNLNTGDLAILSSYDRINQKEEHLKEAKFHIVYTVKSEKYLTELKPLEDYSFLSIPLEITKKLTHPKLNIIKSYSQLYDLGLKNYTNCFNSIELDFKTHLDYLPVDANLDQVVQTHGKLFYCFKTPIDINNNLIKIDEHFYSILKSTGLDSTMENLELEFDGEDCDEVLDENNECQLVDELSMPEEERDLEMEDFAKQFKNIYENDFMSYLKNLKQGQQLNATSLPIKKYNKETYEEDSAESTTLVFYFENLEIDEKGHINLVETTSFDKTEKCFFSPFLCKDYGPYFKTNLLCSFYNIGRSKDKEAQHFFIDLPIHLYNLIE